MYSTECQAWLEHMDCTSKFISNRWSTALALHCQPIECEIPQNEQSTPILSSPHRQLMAKKKNKTKTNVYRDLLGEHWGCSLVDLLHICLYTNVFFNANQSNDTSLLWFETLHWAFDRPFIMSFKAVFDNMTVLHHEPCILPNSIPAPFPTTVLWTIHW